MPLRRVALPKRLKIPSEITIKGERWRVVLDPNLASRKLLGLCLYSERLILINVFLSQTMQEETFLHELLHACMPQEGRARRRLRISDHKEETMIEAIDRPLMFALRKLVWR